MLMVRDERERVTSDDKVTSDDGVTELASLLPSCAAIGASLSCRCRLCFRVNFSGVALG